jgi:hypothetical protein
MKKGLFDDLARTLATPMPRRGALRTMGAALAIGAFRALRPGRAAGYAGSTSVCPPECPDPREPTPCCVPVGRYGGYHIAGCCRRGEDCCIGPNDSEEHPNPMSWCCTAGTCLPSGAKCMRKCTNEEVECGRNCCSPLRGESCGSTIRDLCCKRGESPCRGAASGGAFDGRCCKPGTTCCFTATSVDCCDGNHKCVNGSCK